MNSPTAIQDPADPVRVEWNLAYAEYLRRLALRDADWDHGAFGAAMRQKVAAPDEAFRLAELAHARDFYEPLEAAAWALIMTDAPDLEALTVKVEIAQAYELRSSRQYPENPERAVGEDLMRLIGFEVVARRSRLMTDAPLRAWLREWKALHGSIHVDQANNHIMVGERVFFRGPDWAAMAADERYEPHLRIYERAELEGARKALKRLLVEAPEALEAIAALAEVQHG